MVTDLGRVFVFAGQVCQVEVAGGAQQGGGSSDGSQVQVSTVKAIPLKENFLVTSSQLCQMITMCSWHLAGSFVHLCFTGFVQSCQLFIVRQQSRIENESRVYSSVPGMNGT